MILEYDAKSRTITFQFYVLIRRIEVMILRPSGI